MIYRVACTGCDSDEMDGISEERFAQLSLEGWSDITFVQTYEQSCRTFEDGKESKGHSVLEWFTHTALCPDCQGGQE